MTTQKKFTQQCVLEMLKSTADKVLLCEINLKNFAEKVGFNRNTVKKQLKILEQEGILKKVFCIRDDGNIECKYFLSSNLDDVP